MKIYLIRHGQTTGDIEDRFGGTYDDHLSEKGIEQSKKLADELKDQGIEIIYSSPYLRAKETAEILSKSLNIPVEIVEDLKERDNYGFMSGKKKQEMTEKYPEIVKKLEDYRFTIEGAEDYDNFKERILEAINKISKKNYKTIAIVSHGGPIRCFYREVLSPGKEFIPGDCKVLEIEHRDNLYKLNS